jgi:hypothetical protein
LSSTLLDSSVSGVAGDALGADKYLEAVYRTHQVLIGWICFISSKNNIKWQDGVCRPKISISQEQVHEHLRYTKYLMVMFAYFLLHSNSFSLRLICARRLWNYTLIVLYIPYR